MTRTFLLITSLALTGCQGTPPLPPAPTEPGDLVGEVRFPARQVQATLEEVAVAATVSLINAQTNRTESTTLTSQSGAFRLTFGTSFRPSATDSYYLEAVKGLGSNRAGNNAARLRTLARYNQGWTTLTNASAGSGIVLNTATTALCVGTSLRAGTASAVNLASLIGSYESGAGVYTPVTNLSGADFTALESLAEQLLAEDQDPMAGILLTEPSQWAKKNLSGLTLTQLAPSSGTVGTTVTLSGSGFDPVPANNAVRFNDVLATVSGATANTLTVTVPSGATPGPVSVRIAGLTTTGPVFTVTNLVFGGVLGQN